MFSKSHKSWRLHEGGDCIRGRGGGRRPLDLRSPGTTPMPSWQTCPDSRKCRVFYMII